MALFSIVIALILEQVRPLSQRRFVAAPLAHYASVLEEHFNDGQRRHGMVAWLIGVLPAVISLFIAQWLLLSLHPLIALLLNIGVLYLTMGFRQFSHYFSDIHLALRMGELEQARTLLCEWRNSSTVRYSSTEVARLAIEEALIASHRHVFAPLFWFVLLGPAGALLYRLSLFFYHQWNGDATAKQVRDAPIDNIRNINAFGAFAIRAFTVVDWLSLRVTAAAFAVVGDFEDAVFCWRTQASSWTDTNSGILLASGAGALGVRLGLPLQEVGGLIERPELGLGDEADADYMQSTIGLVWRTLILGLLLLTLFWISGWVGR